MKKMIFAVLLISLLALTACGQQAPSNRRTFAGGNAGIAIAFVEDAPPSDYVTAGGTFPFSVGVVLENKGETDVAQDDVYVELKGIDPEDFGPDNVPVVMKIPPDGDLLGIKLNPDTGAVERFAPAYAYFDLNYQQELPGNHEFPLVVDVCYLYQTRATADLCLKKNLLDTRNTKVCVVTGAKRFENSGAPIGIANFQEYTQGENKVRFTFEISRGAGKVYEKESQCAYDEQGNIGDVRALEDKVYVTVKTGMNGLDCQGLNSAGDTAEGYVKLVGGSKTVSCSQDVSNDKEDKIKLVDITLDYDFLDTIATSVLVKPSGQ